MSIMFIISGTLQFYTFVVGFWLLGNTAHVVQMAHVSGQSLDEYYTAVQQSVVSAFSHRELSWQRSHR